MSVSASTNLFEYTPDKNEIVLKIVNLREVVS